MKILVSVPSGAHARAMLLPLKRFFEEDTEIEKVIGISPGAPYPEQLFPGYGGKFEFIENPKTQAEHDDLVRNLAPDIVVTTTSGLDPKDPLILQAGKNNDIPTLTYVESWDNIWKMERFAKQGKPQLIADHIIVWNEMMKAHLLRAFSELSGEKISVIGSARFDLFFHTDKIPSREELLKQLALAPAGHSLGEGWKDGPPPLIHFSTTELYPFEYIVKSVHKAVQKKQITHQPHFLASVHPGGKMENHDALKNYGAVVQYSFGRHPESPIRDFFYNPTEEELYLLIALFKYSNLLINHSSTTALESMLADVPIVNVKYGRPLDFWHWRKSPVFKDFQEHYADLVSDGATAVVTSERELIAATQNYLDHPELDHEARQKTLKKMITTTNGTASQKVFQKIKDQAK